MRDEQKQTPQDVCEEARVQDCLEFHPTWGNISQKYPKARDFQEKRVAEFEGSCPRNFYSVNLGPRKQHKQHMSRTASPPKLNKRL